MRIAIHASDLDHDRIDGTRVYVLNLLKNFGTLAREDSFAIYHQNTFNPQLAPPQMANYCIKSLPFPTSWTQTRFAYELWKTNPEVLWMPVHNLPVLRRKKLKTVITIHDLAFKIFPTYFPKKDLRKLNRLADLAIKNAGQLIAVSDATKQDILKFYPEISADKITVIHHGFDCNLFEKISHCEQAEKILASYELQAKNYLLYVGAIQPRKNLVVLIEAFEKLKAGADEKQKNLKLVLAGGLAWQYGPTLDRIAASPFHEDIIITGTLPFAHLPVLYQNASVFVFPPLYEGFGIPVLEAMASGVPVVCADNSSLPEVAGDAALFFQTENAQHLAGQIEKILTDDKFAGELRQKGLQQAKKFSWQACAQKTLDVLRSLKTD